ncbi:DNA-directed RNA polymerase I subunit RPA12-like [Tripterygium wilfordii]|nr:DNA-directed RNA polymerase I subunit RPA12-like [Tripterygium wilfordii]XP_038714816.1 DNA-directed RNA polymerase I subunit RPA12-like [Tripterygium wilfordii]
MKAYSMAYSKGRDFLFCGLCGTMLTLDSTKYAKCPLCYYKRNIKEISGREISYRVSAEDIRRELGISHFDEGKVQKSKINKQCERCPSTELLYFSRQMRSADEGQTTFYECPKCGYTFSEN